MCELIGRQQEKRRRQLMMSFDQQCLGRKT
jgi:hypothetical protein